MDAERTLLLLAEYRRRRTDPIAFARELGVEPDKWQAKLLCSQSKQIILNCGRQTGKSTTAAIRALHRAGKTPRWLTLLLSPSLRQSSELFRKVAEFAKRKRFELEEDNRLSMQLENGSRIVSLPSSEGTIRGFSGVNEIIVDEAAFVSDELYKSVRPMLAVSGGSVVLMSTPFGRRGFFFESWNADGWEKYQVKATECSRIADEFLQQERLALGPWFQQEYEGEFIDTDESVFDSRFVHSALSEEVAPL